MTPPGADPERGESSYLEPMHWTSTRIGDEIAELESENPSDQREIWRQEVLARSLQCKEPLPHPRPQ